MKNSFDFIAEANWKLKFNTLTLDSFILNKQI